MLRAMSTTIQAIAPHRRWRQLSLRTLMLLMLLSGCGFGWLGREIQRARRERKAIAAMRFGDAKYSPISGAIPRAALTWLGDLMGEDLSVQVTSVNLRPYNDPIEFPDFDAATATDTDLVHIRQLTALRELWLTDTRVTDAALARLKQLTQLRRLDLSNTQVTGTGFANPGELTGLEWLDLSETPLTNAGLEILGGLTHLKFLFLSNTQVSNAGLSHVRRLTQLESLNLDGTRITDAGLVHLRELTHLRCLSIQKTQITDAGVAEFQQALPNCEIIR